MDGVEVWLGALTNRIKETLSSMMLPATSDVNSGVAVEEWAIKVVYVYIEYIDTIYNKD